MKTIYLISQYAHGNLNYLRAYTTRKAADADPEADYVEMIKLYEDGES